MRRGFSAIEILTVLAIIAVLAGMSVPFWRNYMMRSDLHLAAEQTNQLLRRAQILAQSGDEGAWGVYVPGGIMYQGSSFAFRDESLDEVLPIPASVSVSGLQDVSFSALYAAPNTTGDIILESSNGEQIKISIADNLLGEPTVSDDLPTAAIKFTFVRIKNSGKGSAEPTVHIGEEIYEEDVWIPLTAGGQIITDETITYGATGIAIQRTPDFVRVLQHGALPDKGSKEVVDVRISLENASVSDVFNDIGPDETENPFDGNVNDGVGGDEVTQESAQNVFFQTRVTNAGDSILIYWQPPASRQGW